MILPNIQWHYLTNQKLNFVETSEAKIGERQSLEQNVVII